jgi:hypothetical protein
MIGERLVDGIPVAPPPPLEEVQQAARAAQHDGFSRRSLLKGLGVLVGTAVVGEQAENKMSNLVEAVMWPTEPGRFELVGDTGELQKGGTQYTAWGGLGREDSAGAADDLFYMPLKKKHAIWNVVYPKGQYWGAADMAEIWYPRIRQERAHELAIYGGSEGTIIALQTYQHMAERPDEFPELPPIRSVVANSSPACVADVKAKEVVHLLTRLVQDFRFRPGVGSLIIYNSFDGVGDSDKALEFWHPKRWADHEWDSIKQLSYDCSPENIASQLMFLPRSQPDRYHGILRLADFLLVTSLSDNVIYNQASTASWGDAGAQHFSTVCSGANSHNNTAEAMPEISRWGKFYQPA